MQNENEPATKQDIRMVQQGVETLRAEVKQDVEMLRSEVHHVHDTLLERIAASETKLLKAFYTFAESNQTRLAAIEAISEAVKKRVGILEERVRDLERKVNFPEYPQQ